MNDTYTDIITPDEFEKRMSAIYQECYVEDLDPEMAHYKVDMLINEVLVGLGYGKGLDIFKTSPKWYG
jgi:hypothetical protein